MIALLRDAGGLPVFAHPIATRRGPTVSDEVVAQMAAAGLVGLEVDHPDHGPDDRDRAAALARELHLVATGSSDYHGSNKTRNPLGACRTAPAQFEALLEHAQRPGAGVTNTPLPQMPQPLFSCTPSRLAAFDCPRRYRFTYLDRPRPPSGPPWAHNTVGAAVHTALARWWWLPRDRRTPDEGERLTERAWPSSAGATWRAFATTPTRSVTAMSRPGGCATTSPSTPTRTTSRWASSAR